MDKYTASAGAISSATAAITTDLELSKIALVGVLGAIAYTMKSIKMAEAKANPWGTLLMLPWMILAPASLTAIVYYLGTDGFNIYIKDAGEPIWTFIGLAAGLFNDKIFDFIGVSAVMGRDKKYKDSK